MKKLAQKREGCTVFPAPEPEKPAVPDAPEPFPKPFQINLPKWELPKAEKP